MAVSMSFHRIHAHTHKTYKERTRTLCALLIWGVRTTAVVVVVAVLRDDCCFFWLTYLNCLYLGRTRVGSTEWQRRNWNRVEQRDGFALHKICTERCTSQYHHKTFSIKCWVSHSVFRWFSPLLCVSFGGRFNSFESRYIIYCDTLKIFHWMTLPYRWAREREWHEIIIKRNTVGVAN